MMNMKKCKKCEEVKSDFLFYENRRVCQSCYRENQNGYYARNREKVKQRSLRRYYELKLK